MFLGPSLSVKIRISLSSKFGPI